LVFATASSVTSMLCVPAARNPCAPAALQIAAIDAAWASASRFAVAGSNAIGSR